MAKSGNMEWVKTTAAAPYENYILRDGDQSLLHFHYNARTGTARLETGNERRVYMIDKTGFLRRRIALLNEYGMEIGHLGFENLFGREGFIQVEEERFLYRMQNNPMAELVIYKDHYGDPLVSCGLKAEAGTGSMIKVAFDTNQSLEESKTAALLLALCWYLFLPVAKESVEYAS